MFEDVSTVISSGLIISLVTKTTSASLGLSNDVVTTVLSLFSLTVSEKNMSHITFYNVARPFFKAEAK